MEQQCSICRNPSLAAEVNRLLSSGFSEKRVSKETGCHKSSVHRHRRCIARGFARRSPLSIGIRYTIKNPTTGRYVADDETTLKQAFAHAARDLARSLKTDEAKRGALMAFQRVARLLGFGGDDEPDEIHSRPVLADENAIAGDYANDIGAAGRSSHLDRNNASGAAPIDSPTGAGDTAAGE